MYRHEDFEALHLYLAFDCSKIELNLARQKTLLELDSYADLNDTSQLPLDDFSRDQVDFLLQLAAYEGNHESISVLMTKSTCSNYLKMVCDMNALHLAVAKGHTKCVAAILEYGVFREAWLKTQLHHKFSPLHLAVYLEQLPCLQVILNLAGDRSDVIDFMHNDNARCTPLHIAAMLDSVEAAEILLKNGADIEARTSFFTPLHVAAQYENHRMAVWLLTQGADWKSETPQGVMALALLEHHVPDAMTAYLDSCISLREPELHWDRVTIVVDSSKLTSKPLHMTGSLLSDFQQVGSYRRLEHPVCQILLSHITCQLTSYLTVYFSYIIMEMLISSFFLLSLYGCICIPNVNSTMVNGDLNTTCLYAMEDTFCDKISSGGFEGAIVTVLQYLQLLIIFVTVTLKIYVAVLQIRSKTKISRYDVMKEILKTENWVDAASNILMVYLFIVRGNLTSDDIYLQKVASLTIMLRSWNLLFKTSGFPWLGIYVTMLFSAVREYYVGFTLRKRKGI